MTRYLTGLAFGRGYGRAYGLRSLLRGLATVERTKDREYAAGCCDAAIEAVQAAEANHG